MAQVEPWLVMTLRHPRSNSLAVRIRSEELNILLMNSAIKLKKNYLGYEYETIRRGHHCKITVNRDETYRGWSYDIYIDGSLKYSDGGETMRLHGIRENTLMWFDMEIDEIKKWD